MKLFSSLEIGGIHLENCLVRSATGEGAAVLDTGEPTPAMAEFYQRLASGGIGLVISGHVAVSYEGRCSNTMTAFYSDDFVPAFRRLVDACHEGGAPIVCQLNHGGRQVNPEHQGIKALCPSSVLVDGGAGLPPEELSSDGIERLIDAFGQAARRCKEAGFDGVQIHSAHGYLISQFNSPLTNYRTDRWGGSPEKRRAFLQAIYGAMRRQVGAEFPILVKQNVAEFHAGGMLLTDAIAVCGMLDDLGVAAIELSGGIAETIPVAFRAKEISEKGESVFFEEECRRIRDTVSCPLILTGGIRTVATAERLLAEGICNGIGLCRPMIREVDLPRKWLHEKADRALCISCGKCGTSPDRCNYCTLDEAGT